MKSYILTLSKFKPIIEINHETDSSVMLVLDNETGKHYAAKIYQNSPKSSILQEIEYMALFHHSTLVNFIGYSLSDFNGNPNITIIMDYCSNGSLSDYLNKKKMNNTELQIVIIGICRAMKYIHQKKFIIRHLLAVNVLLDENLHPHVFNFTKYNNNDIFYDDRTLGLQYYIAPEIIKKMNVSNKSDIYCFSILLFQLVTKKYNIYDGEMTVAECIQNVVINGQRPEFPKSINQNIKELIETCWSDDPDNRPEFDELFQKFAFDSKYYLDGVDVEKLNSYVSSILLD